MAHRILILGGTTEARQLAERLAGRAELDVTVSLAGRVADIVAHPVPVRVGGFGGADGLAAWLRGEHVDLLIDATHPFADQMSKNAAGAALATGTPMLVLRRPAWTAVPGDRWQRVPDEAAAAAALGEAPRRVFLALGRQHVAAFAAAPQHFYLVRSIEPVADRVLPDAAYVEARGPFAAADERALMEAHGIDVVVARNSGGSAGYGKVAAARALSIPVVMIEPPDRPPGDAAETVEDAVAWIDHRLASATLRGA
jgi:precorrin-6A/cobalt-precorrin-6A reductase